MNFKDKNILVTGGAGFVGQHLVAALLGYGAEVTVADNFQTGTRAGLSHLDSTRLRVLEHDVAVPLDVTCDVIFNLACPASPRHYQADPVGTWKTSVLGALHLSELALRQGARFVQASTSEVYGDPQVHPQTEDYVGHVSFTGPRACYDEGKRAAETLLHDLHRTKALDLRVARVFNTYGPGMAVEDGRVVSTFVVQALTGQALTVQGDGLQTRSFCHVSDTVRGLLRLAEVEDIAGAVTNIGNPSERSILDLAEVICRMTGAELRIEPQPAAIDDPKQRCPNIKRAAQLLHWRPEVSLEEGLGDTIGWFKSRVETMTAGV